MEQADPDDMSFELTSIDEEESSMYADATTVGLKNMTTTGQLTTLPDHPQKRNTAYTSSPTDNKSITMVHDDDSNHHDSTTTATNNNDDRYAQWQAHILTWPKEIRNIIAGGLAGMVAKSVVAPFDRIKILYQVSSAQFHIWNVPHTARKIVQGEGFQALWKGNTATLIRVFPYSGIQFMVFDRCKTLILREHEVVYQREQKAHRPTTTTTTTKPKWGLTPVESLVAGMTAGAVSVIATYPLDLTRAQLAVLRTKKGAKNTGFGAALYSNYNSRGVVGLFRGITPTLMGILPYSGLAFSFNEQAKRKIQNMKGGDITTIERMQCGALSGLFAQSLTYPLEVTRRRMQTIGIVATSGKDAAVDMVGAAHGRNPAAENAIRALVPDHPPSMATIVKELYQEQGVRGFFKGVTLNWFKGPIAFSISFTAFDVLQSFLETKEERRLRMPRRRTTIKQ